MAVRILNLHQIENFIRNLHHEEKSAATIEKYTRDVRALMQYAENRSLTKELVKAYKQSLIDKGYAVKSINSILASINSLLKYLGWQDCKVRSLRQQRRIYSSADRELTKAEYYRLISASHKKPRLNMLIKTICSTGIRVSELRYFTIEAVKQGEVIINCKSKTRVILVPEKLRAMLLSYAQESNIKSGPIFITKSGRPLDRSNIWSEMKKLCRVAGVEAKKVFPHNLRKLFARSFYTSEKDIAKLADVLGHSSIETTRIYIMETGRKHRHAIEKLGLII